MSSSRAASITVLPLGTWTGLPSTSRFSMRCALHVGRDDARPVVDVMLELGAEVLDEALHRQRGGVAQRADGAPGDVVGDVVQHVEVRARALAVLDPVHHAVEPAGAF